MPCEDPGCKNNCVRPPIDFCGAAGSKLPRRRLVKRAKSAIESSEVTGREKESAGKETENIPDAALREEKHTVEKTGSRKAQSAIISQRKRTVKKESDSDSSSSSSSDSDSDSSSQSSSEEPKLELKSGYSVAYRSIEESKPLFATAAQPVDPPAKHAVLFEPAVFTPQPVSIPRVPLKGNSGNRMSLEESTQKPTTFAEVVSRAAKKKAEEASSRPATLEGKKSRKSSKTSASRTAKEKSSKSSSRSSAPKRKKAQKDDSVDMEEEVDNCLCEDCIPTSSRVRAVTARLASNTSQLCTDPSCSCAAGSLPTNSDPSSFSVNQSDNILHRSMNASGQLGTIFLGAAGILALAMTVIVYFQNRKTTTGQRASVARL